jgi:hypothetical protein
MMGLDVCVGFLAQFRDEPQDFEDLAPEFEALSKALSSLGIEGYREPVELPDEAVFSSRIGPYGTLHFLRRLAAYLREGLELPAPGDENAPEDPVLARCYQGFDPAKGRPFDHLLNHSDAEGYYVPLDFPKVLEPPEEFRVAGGTVGSSDRLRQECEALAQVLELPLSLDPESDEVWKAEEEQGVSAVKWRRYAVEARVCLVLPRAAELSIRYGSAIVFA